MADDREDMKLPPGKTCADCQFFARFCVWYLGDNCQPTNTECDWKPSRFRPMPRALAVARVPGQGGGE